MRNVSMCNIKIHTVQGNIDGVFSSNWTHEGFNYISLHTKHWKLQDIFFIRQLTFGVGNLQDWERGLLNTIYTILLWDNHSIINLESQDINSASALGSIHFNLISEWRFNIFLQKAFIFNKKYNLELIQRVYKPAIALF